jgi:hypothetical protein
MMIKLIKILNRKFEKFLDKLHFPYFSNKEPAPEPAPQAA